MCLVAGNSGNYLNIEVHFHLCDVAEEDCARCSMVRRPLSFKLIEVVCNNRPAFVSEFVPKVAHEGLLEKLTA